MEYHSILLAGLQGQHMSHGALLEAKARTMAEILLRLLMWTCAKAWQMPMSLAFLSCFQVLKFDSVATVRNRPDL